MALLVLRRAVVAGAGHGCLVDFGEIEDEVGSDVGMVLVDAAVEDGNADASAFRGVPRAGGGTAGNGFAVAAREDGGPALRGLIVDIGFGSKEGLGDLNVVDTTDGRERCSAW